MAPKMEYIPIYYIHKIYILYTYMYVGLQPWELLRNI